ncbi:MAG: tetratricopeptide repeat protein, partial [Promethearchaeota archaeon]
SLMKHSDVNRAIELLHSAREMSERLGFRHNIGLIQQHLAHTLGLRGETNAAIDHHIEYQNVLASLGLPAFGMNTVIAFYYNQIGDGEKALELVTSVPETIASMRPFSTSNHIQAAYALINLGRLEDAKDALATAHDLAIKSGVSSNLMYYRTVEGILDKAERRYDAAIDCFKDVLKFIEDNPIPLWQNICLLNLTEIEIDRLSDESLSKESDSSGVWMKRLFEHVEKNDLPGVAARALLLKAKLHYKQGRLDEAREMLREVKKKAESPSMRYLNDLAITMMPDLIVG